MPVDNLKRLSHEVSQLEGSTQNWMTIHHTLPGSL